jgi:hypothetical protein
VAIFQPDQHDAAVEAILWASRPEPDPAWVEGLERRLLTPRSARRLANLRPRLGLSFALAGGLAVVAVTLSLAGVGPLVRQSDSVDARDDCQVVTIPAIERVPLLVRDPDGAARLIYRDRRVTRRVTRCSRSARPRGAAGPGHAK